MAVGCLIYMDKEGKVFHRLPCWPWPKPGVYPQKLEDEGYVQFFPINYFRFKIGDVVETFPPVPYIPKEERNGNLYHDE